MLDLVEVGHGVDILTVQEESEQEERAGFGRRPAVSGFLSEGLPRKFSIESYVRIVKDKSLMRQLMRFAMWA